MVYEKYMRASELNGWGLETSIAWDRLDRERAASQPWILSALHDAALIEGYLPVYLPGLMRRMSDDVDATAVFSLEMFEGLKHYTALKRYLDIVGYEGSVIEVAELRDARGRTADRPRAEGDAVEELTHFMGSEHYAAFFFLQLSRKTVEPVLKELLTHMAHDEFRHRDSASDLLACRLEREPEARRSILHAAANFRHYGSDVVDVPVAEEHNIEAIRAFNRKVRQLCGQDLPAFIRGEMTNGNH